LVWEFNNTIDDNRFKTPSICIMLDQSNTTKITKKKENNKLKELVFKNRKLKIDTENHLS